MSNTTDKYDFGMIGLGTMGRNLLLNMGDHGVKGAGFDKDASKGQLLRKRKQAWQPERALAMLNLCSQP